MTRYNTSNNVIEFFNGTNWIGIGLLDGSSPSTAAPSAQSIKNITGTNTNTSYWIALPSVGATSLFCAMDSAYAGGGWIMAMKSTAGSTDFSYSSGYWTGINVLNETSTSQSDATSKFNSFNYFQGTQILARFPDVSAGGTIGGLGGWVWNETMPGGTRTLQNFFANQAITYVRENDAIFAWAGHGNNGPFSAQGGWRKYGYNLNIGNSQCRWGFTWNNESGEANSSDVYSGIGLGGPRAWSCGDSVGCCQTYTGVNRQMRMEMYVR
jgi:hypothetical protein